MGLYPLDIQLPLFDLFPDEVPAYRKALHLQVLNRFRALATAARLSQTRSIGPVRRPKSKSSFPRNIASSAAMDAAMYSATVVDLTTQACLRLKAAFCLPTEWVHTTRREKFQSGFCTCPHSRHSWHQPTLMLALHAHKLSVPDACDTEAPSPSWYSDI
jgi:hypothetical protein